MRAQQTPSSSKISAQEYHGCTALCTGTESIVQCTAVQLYRYVVAGILTNISFKFHVDFYCIRFGFTFFSPYNTVHCAMVRWTDRSVCSVPKRSQTSVPFTKHFSNIIIIILGYHRGNSTLHSNENFNFGDESKWINQCLIDSNFISCDETQCHNCCDSKMEHRRLLNDCLVEDINVWPSICRVLFHSVRIQLSNDKVMHFEVWIFGNIHVVADGVLFSFARKHLLLLAFGFLSLRLLSRYDFEWNFALSTFAYEQLCVVNCSGS